MSGMTKNLLNVLMPELKNKLLESEMQKARPRSRKKCRKEQNEYEISWNNIIDFSEMDD